MDRFVLLMIASLLSGFALINLPLEGSFLSSIEPITDIIGILTVLGFSLYIIYKGIKAILAN